MSPLWVKSGHLVWPAERPLSATSGHRTLPQYQRRADPLRTARRGTDVLAASVRKPGALYSALHRLALMADEKFKAASFLSHSAGCAFHRPRDRLDWPPVIRLVRPGIASVL